MNHPLLAIPQSSRKPLFWALFIFTIVVMYCLNLMGEPLITAPAPYGIVSFELAGSADRAQEILDSWDETAQMHAAFSLGFDYLYMVLYSTTIALACIWGAVLLQNHGWPGAWLGLILAWGQWLAATFDGIENLALSLILFGGPAAPWPQVAQIAAMIKFGLIFFGLIFSFFSLIVRFWKR